VLTRADRFLARILSHPAAPLSCVAIVVLSLIAISFDAGGEVADLAEWRP